MTPKVSIIIVNYNVKDLLMKCLASIYKFNHELFEIIVVDNNSTDGSIEFIKNEFPNVILIENKFNAGFSGANNQGMEIATGNYIFLLNPDTEFKNEVVKILSDFMDKNVDCVVVAPQLLNSDLSIQYSAWENHSPIDLLYETFYLHHLLSKINYPKEKFNTTFQAKTLSGAALFFNRKLLHQLTGLNEILFWMEDIDFCFRAQQYGKLIYNKDAIVVHHSGQSQKKNYNVSISNQILSKLKYYKQNFSISWCYLANFSCLIFILSRCIILMLLSPFKSIYKLKRSAYFYTLKRFWRYILFNDLSLT